MATLADVALGDVGLDLERAHVGHRDHRALRAGGAGKRRDHVADVGVLDQHHAVERRADLGVGRFTACTCSWAAAAAMLPRARGDRRPAAGGDAGARGIGAPPRRVHRLRRDEVLRLQAPARAAVRRRRWPASTCAWRKPASACCSAGFGLAHAGLRGLHGGRHVAGVEAADQLALLDRRCLRARAVRSGARWPCSTPRRGAAPPRSPKR